MTEYTPIIIAVGAMVVAIIVGFFIGKYVASLKYKTDSSTVQERANQLQYNMMNSKRLRKSSWQS